MDPDLAFFAGLSALVSDRLVSDLRDEKRQPNPEPKKKSPKAFKLPKSAPPTVTLEAAPSDSDSGSDAEDPPAAESSDAESAPPKEGGMQFSRLHVPTKVPTTMKKGKNKYQKLREAMYRERTEAGAEVEATWDKVKAAAAGAKVEQTSTQIRKTMKREQQQKRKRFEKKMEKEVKQKKQEEKEAKKKDARIQKGRRFDKAAHQKKKGGPRKH